jgi:diguanylate cyclase (GGDEF)-like protein
MPMPSTLYESIFHTLEEQIALIDQRGDILSVNLSWQSFGTENDLPRGYSCVGHNYLETLSNSVAAGDSFAGDALQGIVDVMAGKLAYFYHEYPCHSLNEKRWFTMRVTRLHCDESSGLFVISHHNVTQRKLAEERVAELAMQDPLTGLGNRRAFNLFLAREIRNSIRNRVPIGLALIDVDYFKNYNDEFGHALGDQCLIKVGQVLLAHARRPDDLAARIGGDEFALILRNTKLDDSRQVAESVLKGVYNLKMVVGGSRQATVSIGFLSVLPDEHQDVDFLFQEADKALYRAKSAGRNQAAYTTLGESITLNLSHR